MNILILSDKHNGAEPCFHALFSRLGHYFEGEGMHFVVEPMSTLTAASASRIRRDAHDVDLFVVCYNGDDAIGGKSGEFAENGIMHAFMAEKARIPVIALFGEGDKVAFDKASRVKSSYQLLTVSSPTGLNSDRLVRSLASRIQDNRSLIRAGLPPEPSRNSVVLMPFREDPRVAAAYKGQTVSL